MSKVIKIAAVQAAPVFLDRDATVSKACDLIREAGHEGAALVVFRETFIPAYPDWVWAIAPGQSDLLDPLYADLLANAVEVPSAATDRLGEAAREAGVYVAIGINERNSEASGATMYNTLLYLGPDGQVLGKHRKLVPTGGERLVWAQGDGSTLAAYDTAFGKLSGLICWENYMPLARYALYAWGTEIYVAPTWDRGSNWLATMQHIALEGRLVVISCCMALHTDHIPDRYAFKAKYYPNAGWINHGDSVIVGPNGQFLAGPLKEQEGILYAEVDLNAVRGAKRMLDVAGHYNRPDVFELTIRTEAHPALRIT